MRHRESNGHWFIGIFAITEDQLVHASEEGKKIIVSGYGIVVIDKKLDDLALEVIERIDSKGKIVASPRVRDTFSKK